MGRPQSSVLNSGNLFPPVLNPPEYLNLAKFANPSINLNHCIRIKPGSATKPPTLEDRIRNLEDKFLQNKCFSSNCTSVASIKCNCHNQLQFMCQYHLLSHVQSSDTHPELSEINEDIILPQDSLLAYYKSAIAYLNSLKTQLFLIANEPIRSLKLSLSKICAEFKKVEDIYKNAVKKLHIGKFHWQGEKMFQETKIARFSIVRAYCLIF